jgi:hypothetical protein
MAQYGLCHFCRHRVRKTISTPAAVIGAVGKWETHGFALSKLAVGGLNEKPSPRRSERGSLW